MPDKKCLYKERMESAVSRASMDNTNKNRVLAVGIEKSCKINVEIE